MPLNLEHVDGELTIAHQADGRESYRVHPTHPAYQLLWHTGLSINAMTIAICAIGNEPIPTAGHMSLACKAHHLTVKLPAYDMVKAVKEDSEGISGWIELSFVGHREPGKNDGWATGIRRWMWLEVAAAFVELFEQHHKRAHRRNHEVARMAMVIRDSCAHGLNVTTKRSGGAELGDLKITRDHHGRPLSDFFDLGDFFVFALRMFNGQTPSQCRSSS